MVQKSVSSWSTFAHVFLWRKESQYHAYGLQHQSWMPHHLPPWFPMWYWRRKLPQIEALVKSSSEWGLTSTIIQVQLVEFCKLATVPLAIQTLIEYFVWNLKLISLVCFDGKNSEYFSINHKNVGKQTSTGLPLLCI